jgi:carbamoyl-phosphate synthase small subunit
MLDFGAHGNIISELNARGCGVAALGWDTPADVLLDGANAVVLSGGPGDPHAYEAAIETVRELLRREVPLLGFGLGHQIMALAAGGECYRMPCGHRGGNQPVRDTATGRVRISSQNHGWAVASAFDGARVAFVNINDDTIEGLRYTDIPATGLQFFPSTAGGPDDMSFIYDEFLKGVC